MKTARRLELWLQRLIAAYQDRRLKPRDRRYTNLTHMRRPTQMYAISLKLGVRNIAAVIIGHREDVANGTAHAVRVDSLEELADFSEGADKFFGTEDLRSDKRSDFPYLFPEFGVAQQGCMSLGASVRRAGHLRLKRGTFDVGQMTALQVLPPGALWDVTYRGPLPEPKAILLRLGRPRQRRTLPKTPTPDRPEQPRPAPASLAYAAFPEPLVWFGVPPFPSIKDRILQRLWLPTHRQRLLFRARVGGIETLVYDNSLILAVSEDRRLARATINQVFAVLSRSGVESGAVSDFELLEVTQFESESGEIKGSSGAVTPRNRLLDVPSVNRLAQVSLRLPEETMEPLLALADECCRDHGQAVASLRLLNAATLFSRESYTEAFVTAWSLVETSIGRDFESFWAGQGRSKAAIRDMDWKASEQIDLLIAIGHLDQSLGLRIHALRKRRNAIVHDLADATEKDALGCREVAAIRTPLPVFPEKLRAQVVLL